MLMFVLEANRMFLKLIINKWVLVLEHLEFILYQLLWKLISVVVYIMYNLPLEIKYKQLIINQSINLFKLEKKEDFQIILFPAVIQL